MSIFAFPPALRRAGLLTLSLSLLALAACQDDEDNITPAATSQEVTLEFGHHGSDAAPLVYGRTYTTARGAHYTIDSLKYYVSNVSFTRADSTVWTAPQAYYLVRATSAPADNVQLEIPDVPFGNYTHVTFSVGVDNARNYYGDQTGVLAPRYGMLWSWNTGYKFLALNGHYLPPTGAPVVLQYHLAGDAIYRTLTLTLPLPEAITVTEHIAPEIHLAVAVNDLFGGVNQADLTDPAQQAVMGASAPIAANAAGMFSVEHVHNEAHTH